VSVSRVYDGKGRRRLTIIIVVANDELLQLTVFAELTPNILVKRIEVVLELARIHAILRVVCGILVQVRHEDGLAVGRLDMFSRASITVSAGTDFLDIVSVLGFEKGHSTGRKMSNSADLQSRMNS
jgi:hypothetical protein